MNKVSKMVMLLWTIPLLANAQGGAHVGGGDPCEDKIKENSFYLKMKIEKGVGNTLQFTNGWTAERYQQTLSAEIQAVFNQQSGATVIECVSKKLEVDGLEKICVGSRSAAGLKKITCNRNSFLALGESTQVRLTHHEWAQLNGIESNSRSSSDYYLTDQVIAALAPTQGVESTVQLPDYPSPYCSYEYRFHHQSRDATSDISEKLAAALATVGCVPVGDRPSLTNHLIIDSSGGPQSYGAEPIDWISPISGETRITNQYNKKSVHTYSEKTAVMNLSIHPGRAGAIFLNRYDAVIRRAVKASEEAAAQQVVSLIQ